MAEIPEDLKQDYDAWKLHRTARFRIEDWMDWGTKAIERIAAQAERIMVLEEKYKESLEFVEAMRDVLISLQPHMGYLPQQKAFSVKMTVNESECGKAIESANEFLARAALGREGRSGFHVRIHG
jgi:hypothetical protein